MFVGYCSLNSIMKIRTVVAVVLLLFACQRQYPLTTTKAAEATLFWCAPNGECLTDEATCKTLGDCARSKQAWCSLGAMGGYRYVCGVNETRCEELAISSREQFNNRCALEPSGRL